MNLSSISALKDNYIWLVDDGLGHCVIIDPGDAIPVLQTLRQRHLQPVAILLTHHHRDHVDGVPELVKNYPGIRVYGPQETKSKGATHHVNDGDILALCGCQFQVMATPGHTLGHVCYLSKPYLFCGDTLFSAGCGRLFEGTAKQMFFSFQRINDLSDDTLICCAHEYTLSNLEFSLGLLPQNQAIADYYHQIKALRAKKESSLPSTLGKERLVNVFLRTQEADLQKNLGFNTPLNHPWDVFAFLREKKDHW